LVSIFVGGRIIQPLICGFFIFNIGLPKERTLLGTRTLPIQVFDGILVNITSGWDRCIRMRYAVPMGMRFSCLNSAVVGHAISGGESEVARVKVRPFLAVASVGENLGIQ
jgi:hypothetical protein